MFLQGDYRTWRLTIRGTIAQPFASLLPATPRITSAAILNNLGDAREVKARTAKIIRVATSAMKVRQIVACTTLNQSEMKLNQLRNYFRIFFSVTVSG